jgi:NADPH-dependent curcumin reductase CurA
MAAQQAEVAVATSHRQVLLKTRPDGVPKASDFEIVTVPVDPLPKGSLLVRNRWLSVDPAMKLWLGPPGAYMAPTPIGAVVPSYAAGEVIASDHPDFDVGDRLVGRFGWQEIVAVDPETIYWKVSYDDLPLSQSLGVIGMNGIAAFVGVNDICKPKSGETFVVSTAAGAVGSAAGQIAKLMGARVVGITGGPEKCRQCIEDFGFDAAVDYKSSEPLLDALKTACPNGIDSYLDLTGGSISDAVRHLITVGARIALCGTAAVPSWNPWPLGERVERHLLNKQALMQGYITSFQRHRWPDALQHLETWARDGGLVGREDILDGIDKAPGSIARLLNGENQGKLVIKL